MYAMSRHRPFNRLPASWGNALGPLPIVFVLCAVEAQRHWNEAIMWPYLASSVLAAFTGLALLSGKSWASGYTNRVADAAILVLIASALVFLVSGNAAGSIALSNTLLFWAPLICLWWGISLPNRDRLALFFFVMLYGLPLAAGAYKPDILYFERALLGALTLLVARQFARDRSLNERMLRDRLTGLISAECFETELAMIAAMADRYRVSFSLIACAPDRLGDASPPGSTFSETLLQSMASLIADQIRQSDTVCRWEGNVFFILLPNTSSHDADRVAQGLLAAFPGLAQDTISPLTCSLGIAAHQFGEDPMLTFGSAEKALNESILAGGNRATVVKTAR